KALIAAEFTNGRPAPRTVNGFVTTLGAVLNSAVEDGILPSNPALRLGKVIRRDQGQVEEVEVFTADEVNALIAAADPEFRPFVLLLARTGLRLGEALALRWEDVDWAARTVLVRRSTRHGITSVPKNGKARRVDLSPQLSRALKGWQSLLEAEAALAGQGGPDWIFPAFRVAHV